MGWLEALGQASLGGALVFVLVWALCRFLPRLHPAVRFWLWWLVAARLVVGLALSGVSLPVAVLAPVAAPRATRSRPTPPAALLAPAPPSAALTEPQSVAAPVRRPAAPPRVSWLLALWGLVGGLILFRDLARALRLRRRLGRLRPDRDGVAVSPSVASPLVIGLWRPVIVLPEGLSIEERAMALAHERAHLRRGDLCLGLILTAARALFWFLPFMPFVVREAEAAREEACDRLARQDGVRAAAYGRLLLRLSMEAVPGGLGMAAAEHGVLKRRLLALAHAPARASRLTLTLVGLLGAALLLPWRLTARAAMSVARSEPASPRFVIEGLGEGYSDAFAISESGRVAGVSGGERGEGQAFVYEARTRRYERPGTFGQTRSLARAVSDSGQVALTTFTRTNRPRGWVVGEEPRATTIKGVPGFPFVQPLGINAAGTVVGGARKAAIPGDAVGTRAIAARVGRVRDLGTLGGPYSQALGINGRGQIVGKADLAPRPRWVASALGLTPIATHAFLWEAGKMIDLGTLGGDTSRAHAVSDAGQVVGQAQTASGENRAFLWDGEMQELDSLPGSAESVAHDLDEAGRIVGSATDASGARRAILWEGNAVRDLNTLLPSASGWTLQVARAINAHGEIVGQGVFHGKPRAFLLRPVQ